MEIIRDRNFDEERALYGAKDAPAFVRNVKALGISAVDVITMASATPAARMGLKDLGTIEVGKRAHLTAWNDAWQVAFAVTE